MFKGRMKTVWKWEAVYRNWEKDVSVSGFIASEGSIQQRVGPRNTGMGITNLISVLLECNLKTKQELCVADWTPNWNIFEKTNKRVPISVKNWCGWKMELNTGNSCDTGRTCTGHTRAGRLSWSQSMSWSSLQCSVSTWSQEHIL